MGWASRANPRRQTLRRVRAYVRANPEVAVALYRKVEQDEPLPQGTVSRALQALALAKEQAQ